MNSAFNTAFDQNGAINPFAGQQQQQQQQFNFNNNVNPNTLDLSQFQQQQNTPGPPQRFPDGSIQSHSPAVHNGPFQVPPVVPAKRQRPGDDNVGASPHPPPGSMAHSRSQTPQQAPFPYGNPGAPQQFHTSTPFQQMQHNTSSQATPSPVPQNQPFRPNGPQQQQGQMNSPRAFPGQQPQNYNAYAQMQNQMNRMGTPQNAAQQQFMQNLQQAQAFQNMGAGSPPMAGQNMQAGFANFQGGAQNNINPQLQQAQKLQYQMQLANNQQALNAQQRMQSNAVGAQQRAAAMNGPQAGRPMQPGQPGQQQQQQQQQQGQQGQEQSFMASLMSHMSKQGRQINPDPKVCGRPVRYHTLFNAWTKMQPDQHPERWTTIAESLGFPSAQFPTAVQELRDIYTQNLSDFCNKYVQAMRIRRQKMAMDQGQAGAANMQMPQSGLNAQSPMGPTPPNFQQNQQSQSSGPPQSTPNAPMTDLNNASPRPRKPSGPASDMQNDAAHRKTASVMSGMGSPIHPQSGGPQHLPLPGSEGSTGKPTPKTVKLEGGEAASKKLDTEFEPGSRQLDTHGGLYVSASDRGAQLRHLKTTFPVYEELGPVDIQTLNMCLQSNFNQETKFALDTLGALSQGVFSPDRPPQPGLFLSGCEDLVDSLIDCGELQLETIAPFGVDDGEGANIMSFEKVMKAGVQEVESAIEITPAFGDGDYEHEQAVRKLLAITSILRNLSFPIPERAIPDKEITANKKQFTTARGKNFLLKIIRLLGADPSKAFRTMMNAQDVMKDVVTLLSNVADVLVLHKEEEGRAILNFLVAFGPRVSKADWDEEKVEMAGFEPCKNQYLPCAVDALAKLLAVDDPNRTTLKRVLGADCSITPATEALITRAFALSVAAVPCRGGPAFSYFHAKVVAEKRRPWFTQGMLAADILSTMVPSSSGSGDESLPRAWLESADGWALCLLQFVVAASQEDAHTGPQRDATTGHILDPTQRGFVLVCQRGASLLRRLAEKADKSWHSNGKEKASLSVFGIVSLDTLVLTALRVPSYDGDTLKSLSGLAMLAR